MRTDGVPGSPSSMLSEMTATWRQLIEECRVRMPQGDLQGNRWHCTLAQRMQTAANSLDM